MADHAVLRWRRADGETVASIHGDVDSFNAADLFDAIARAGGGEHDRLVVDLRGVTFCRAAGARAMAGLVAHLGAARALRFMIVAGGCVDRVLTLAELREPLERHLLVVPAHAASDVAPRR
jgi:hypothetical protein